jgi:hypothetical protein
MLQAAMYIFLVYFHPELLIECVSSTSMIVERNMPGMETMLYCTVAIRLQRHIYVTWILGVLDVGVMLARKNWTRNWLFLFTPIDYLFLKLAQFWLFDLYIKELFISLQLLEGVVYKQTAIRPTICCISPVIKMRWTKEQVIACATN